MRYVFQKLATAKDVVSQMFMKLCFRTPFAVNMLNSLENCTAALSSHCFITMVEIDLENVRPSYIQNLRSIC